MCECYKSGPEYHNCNNPMKGGSYSQGRLEGIAESYSSNKRSYSGQEGFRGEY